MTNKSITLIKPIHFKKKSHFIKLRSFVLLSIGLSNIFCTPSTLKPHYGHSQCMGPMHRTLNPNQQNYIMNDSLYRNASNNQDEISKNPENPLKNTSKVPSTYHHA